MMFIGCANCCVINKACGMMFIGCANCCVINKALESCLYAVLTVV